MSEIHSLRFNPLRGLTFYESFNKPEAFAEKLQCALISDLDKQSTVSLGSISSATLLGMSLMNQSYLVRLDTGGYLMRAQDGTTKAIRMGTDGRIAEIGTIDWSGQIVAKAGAAMGLIVAVSHIISSAEISRRLADAQNTLQQLVDYRHTDRMGRIKTIYESLVESLDREDDNAIEQCRRSLREERNTILLESQKMLGNLKPLYESVHPMLRALPWRATRKQSMRRSQLASVTSQILLAEYCIRLESVAFVGLSDRCDRQPWLKDTATEIKQLSNTMKLLESDLNQYGKSDRASSCSDLLLQLSQWYSKADQEETELVGKEGNLS
jgi:hypothetical protein